MSYICEIGNNIHFRLMDRIKPHLAEVAIALDFSHHVIDNLEPKRNPVYYVLAEWLKGGNQKHDSRPTWGKLINALRAAGLMEEVNILEQYFVAAPQVAERRGTCTVMIVIDCPNSSLCDILTVVLFTVYLVHLL